MKDCQESEAIPTRGKDMQAMPAREICLVYYTFLEAFALEWARGICLCVRYQAIIMQSNTGKQDR